MNVGHAALSSSMSSEKLRKWMFKLGFALSPVVLVDLMASMHWQ